MKFDYTGQTVLITGATRGIGKQIAEDLAKLGATLLLTGTDKKQISKINETIRPQESDDKYFCVDFSDKGSIDQFIKDIKEYDKIDVCINNAGINRIDYIAEIPTKDWDDIIAVNLKAPFLIIKEVSKKMKKYGYGRIVNIGSIFGSISKEKRAAYSSSKFGLRGLTTAVSNELAKYNILVNSVSPGFVLTDLTREILSMEEMKALAVQVPAGRLAEPEEISRAVIFLASKLNSYITGHNLIMDGGYTNV